MALIQCEDCGKDISDLAPACIHCGRPAKPTDPAPENEGQETARWDQLKERSQALAEGASDFARKLGKRAKKLSASAVDKMFEDRQIDVLVLPLGSGPAEFTCSFDLTEVLEGLESGVLVRPRLRVWAHRSDLDRDRLASDLEQRFSQQVAEFKSKKQAQHDDEASKALATSKEKRVEADKSSRSATKGALAAGLAVLLVTNPLLDLFLLLMAATSGAEAVFEALRESGAEVEEKQTRRKLGSSSKKLQKTVGAHKRAFRSALKQLQLQVHSDLASLADDFSQLDEASPPPTDDAVTSGPSVVAALQRPSYREALPGWYHPLLDSRLEMWS